MMHEQVKKLSHSSHHAYQPDKRKKSESKKNKHFGIPFTVCYSTRAQEPNPFEDELLSFVDSNVITYKHPKKFENAPDQKLLYLRIKAEYDCILIATAKITHESKKSNNFLSSANNTQMKFNSTQEGFFPNNTINNDSDQRAMNLSSTKNLRQSNIDFLHKEDMKNVSFCQLDFGNAICKKQVRDRAIANRIDAILKSQPNKERFESQFTEAKKKHKDLLKSQLSKTQHGDFIKLNASEL